jgi:hypothetical protein
MHRWLAIALAASVFMPLSHSQTTMPNVFAGGRAASLRPGQGPAGSPPLRGITVTFGQRAPFHPLIHPAVFLGTPYFYSDYPSQPMVVQAPPPQVVVVETVPTAVEKAEASKPEPLLIEWQGDRYVRVTQDASARAYRVQSDYSEEPGLRTDTQKVASKYTRPLSSAVLVFRDGRQQEVSSYTIVSGTIYTDADYWTSGAWTRKIQLADLDVPTTLKLNQERGVRFVLPAGPNEVVTRP